MHVAPPMTLYTHSVARSNRIEPRIVELVRYTSDRVLQHRMNRRSTECGFDGILRGQLGATSDSTQDSTEHTIHKWYLSDFKKVDARRPPPWSVSMSYLCCIYQSSYICAGNQPISNRFMKCHLFLPSCILLVLSLILRVLFISLFAALAASATVALKLALTAGRIAG